MNRPLIGVSACALNDGRLLLIQRGKEPAMGKWSLPGGHLEFGEDLHTGVLREFREETGLDAVVDRFLGFRERLPEGPEGRHYVLLNFVVDILNGQEPVAGDDAADVAWFDLESVADVDLNDGLYEFLVDTGIIPDARTFSL